MKKIGSIGIIAPSGDIRNIDEINKKIEILSKDYKVKKFYDENISYNSYLADFDENKIKYLNNAFLDPETDLIIALRGGYGAIRIIDKIDYSKINNSNKIFLGSSDVTALLMSLSKKTNITCYHSLMISNGFVENLKRNIDIIEKNIFDLNIEPVIKGNCKGKLWGGNLSTLVSLLSGESYIPETDIILFLEDLNEPLYKIDKMLYEIYRCEKLRSKIKGIIFGDFYFKKDEIMPLFIEYSELFKVPSYLSFDITHKINNVTLPYLKEIELK